jgi:aminoglycoside N3'-acetyltransferase
LAKEKHISTKFESVPDIYYDTKYFIFSRSILALSPVTLIPYEFLRKIYKIASKVLRMGLKYHRNTSI